MPNSVGLTFKKAGHSVVPLNTGEHLPRGSKDSLVCAYAVMHDLILVATDGDMKAIAKGYGLSNSDYAKVSLVKLSCSEINAAARIEQCISLIEHEWYVSAGSEKRRIFIEILQSVVRLNR